MGAKNETKLKIRVCVLGQILNKILPTLLLQSFLRHQMLGSFRVS